MAINKPASPFVDKNDEADLDMKEDIKEEDLVPELKKNRKKTVHLKDDKTSASEIPVEKVPT